MSAAKATPKKPGLPRAMAACGVVTALAVALLVVYCWPPEARGVTALHGFVPADADAVVWIDELGAAAAALDQLGQAVPGTAGLIDALTVAIGLDPRDADTVERAGLRPDAGAIAYVWHGARWLVLPVLGPRAADHVVGALRRRGHAVVSLPVPATGAAVEYEIRDRVHPERAVGRLRYLPLVVVVCMHPGLAFPAYFDGPTMPASEFLGREGQFHGVARFDAAQKQAMREGLGPAAVVLGGVVDRLQTLQADLDLGRTAARLRARFVAGPGALADVAQYHAGFVPPDPAAWLDLGDLLPDETILLARARLNPALLQLVPAAVRDQILPASALTAVHPALVGVDARTTLVAELDGQLAVAVLAVADEAPLDPQRFAAVGLRKALRVAIAGSLRTDVAAQALLDRCRSALDTSADRPATATIGRWSGFAVAGPEAPWLLLRDGPRVAFVSGAGAREDLVRVAQGKFPSLAQVARGQQAQAVVQGGARGRALWFGAHVETPRIARSLRRRGVPDYAVQMVAGVARATATVLLDDAGVTATVEAIPATDSAIAPGPSPAAAGGAAP
jgi:hypothetical protein